MVHVQYNGLTTVKLFHVDALAITLTTLVITIALIVGCFAQRYFDGDRNKTRFFGQLGLLASAITIMACADHVGLFLIAWAISNGTLTRLMVHKREWNAARASGSLAQAALLFGLVCVGTGFAILSSSTHLTSLHAIAHHAPNTLSTMIALTLILVGALIQSALWPFHRWLLSSLNSPTPVSAIMHAGLVNGGGILLTQCAPLYLAQPTILMSIFVLGVVSAILGTLLKLHQQSIKHILASSTMSQMGFMFMQCGLGLFAAAIAHLFWHSMFKAYLFLSSGSAVHRQTFHGYDPPRSTTLLLAIPAGILCGSMFAYFSHIPWISNDTTFILVAVSGIAGMQIGITLLHQISLLRIGGAYCTAALFGSIHGTSVSLIEWILEPLNLTQPQPLTLTHSLGLIVMVCAWLIMVLRAYRYIPSPFSERLYVAALNMGEPHPATVTSHRNDYKI